jgi:nitrite reductase (NADH) large subunit
MGLNAATIGNVTAIGPQDRVIEFREPTRGQYRKLVLRDRRLVGAILLGDVSAFPALTAAFDSSVRLSEPELGELLPPNAIERKDWPRVA